MNVFYKMTKSTRRKKVKQIRKKRNTRGTIRGGLGLRDILKDKISIKLHCILPIPDPNIYAIIAYLYSLLSNNSNNIIGKYVLVATSADGYGCKYEIPLTPLKQIFDNTPPKRSKTFTKCRSAHLDKIIEFKTLQGASTVSKPHIKIQYQVAYQNLPNPCFLLINDLIYDVLSRRLFEINQLVTDMGSNLDNGTTIGDNIISILNNSPADVIALFNAKLLVLFGKHIMTIDYTAYADTDKLTGLIGLMRNTDRKRVADELKRLNFSGYPKFNKMYKRIVGSVVESLKYNDNLDANEIQQLKKFVLETIKTQMDKYLKSILLSTSFIGSVVYAIEQTNLIATPCQYTGLQFDDHIVLEHRQDNITIIRDSGKDYDTTQLCILPDGVFLKNCPGTMELSKCDVHIRHEFESANQLKDALQLDVVKRRNNNQFTEEISVNNSLDENTTALTNSIYAAETTYLEITYLFFNKTYLYSVNVVNSPHNIVFNYNDDWQSNKADLFMKYSNSETQLRTNLAKDSSII